MVAPFLPETAERLRQALSLDPVVFADLDRPWGSAFTPGHRVGEPINLFPRVEAKRS